MAGFLGLILAAPLQANPRYAARYDQRCGLCHDDPAGGGKRSLYAAQFLVPTEMSWRPMDDKARARIQPMLGPNLSVGVDLRTLHHYSDDRTEPQNFLQMEGNLYLAFQPDARVTAYLTRGTSGSYEVFGIAYVLPYSGYAKVGRLVPPFGWRLPDHSAFVRSYGGFTPPGHSDVGVELGIFPGRLELQAALTNGARGQIGDNDRDLACSGRAAARFHLVGIKGALGGSGAYNGSPGAKASAAGPFGSLSWKSLTWVGEADWSRRDLADGGSVRGLDLTQEFSLRVLPGWDLLATHDFHDPDTGRQTGALNRYGFGVELLPSPFLQLRAVADFYDAQKGPDLPRDDYFQSEVQVHFLY
jgi:hypothetical protein